MNFRFRRRNINHLTEIHPGISSGEKKVYPASDVRVIPLKTTSSILFFVSCITGLNKQNQNNQ